MARTRYQYGELVVKQGKQHRSFMGRWREDFRLPDGRTVRKKRSRVLGIVGEITEKQARRQLETILSRVNDPGYQPESSTTFQSLLKEWEAVAYPEMKPSTIHGFSGHISKHLIPHFGKRQVREITTKDIDTFLASRTCSRKTKKNIFTTLKLILKQGRKWGCVRSNVWEGVKKIGGSKPQTTAYTDAQMESILRMSFGAKRLFYWLAVESGMRAGEMAGLTVQNVDLDRRLVHVKQTVWRGKVQTPKSDAAKRTIPIPAQVAEALREHIGTRTEGFVFQNPTGRPWNTCVLLEKHLKKTLGVKGNLHRFRHTFATRQLQAGVPVSVVSKLLGHAQVSTTLNVYSHVLADHLAQFELNRAPVLGTSWTPSSEEVLEVPMIQ